MYFIEKVGIYLKQYKVFAGVILALMIVIGGGLWFHNYQSNDAQSSGLSQEKMPIEEHMKKTTGKDNNKASPQNIIVDIKGAVKHPNTYTMKAEDRVKQLLDKAEPLDNADLSRINLAEKLTDQKMVYIPERNESNVTNATSSDESGGNAASTSQNQTVNLNTADEKALTQIPGIGPSKAQTIIKYREEHGPFPSIDQLKDVKGIGEKTFEKLKPYFTV